MGSVRCLYFLATIFLSVVLCWADMESLKGKKVSAERRREMLTAQLASSNLPLIYLDDKNLDFYALDSPRFYSLVVLFTARGSEYGCDSCSTVEEELNVLAASHAELKRVLRASEGPEAFKGSRDVFFAVSDFSRNRHTFTEMGIQQVPKVKFFGPRVSVTAEDRYQVDPVNEFRSKSSVITADALAKFVKLKTGLDIPILRSQMKAVFAVAILLCCLIALGYLALTNFSFILGVIRNRWLWMAITAFFYTFSISGGVFDIIRSPPSFHMDKHTGNVMFFHPQANQQFVFEGFIIGFLNLIAGGAAIFLATVAPRLRESSSRSLAVSVCSVVFLLAFYQVMSFYRTKNKWYMSQ